MAGKALFQSTRPRRARRQRLLLRYLVDGFNPRAHAGRDDFSKYIIRDVMEATMFRFNDSAYAKLGQVGFLMWMRTGGNLTDNKAVAYYTNSAT